MILDPVETLKQLVAIPSVNPMGRETDDPTFGEARLTDHLEALFSQIGLPTFRQPVAPGRDNLIAWLEGDVPPSQVGPVLLLDAHQDTVPVEGMTVDPFGAEQRAGRIYGRGACDTKGGMAAVLAAVSRLARQKPHPRPTIVVSFTVNEEYGFTGARRLTQLWNGTGSQVFSCKPHAAVVMEPTGLDVVVASKGMIRWNCTTRGRASHSSCPEAGENAVYRMARAVTAIEHYASELAASDPHPLCGTPTASVGTIHGGISVNIVPDRCTIEIDHRVPPEECPEALRQRLIDDLAGATGADVLLEHDWPTLIAPPLSDRTNGVLADRLFRAADEFSGECRPRGVSYAANAAFYSAAGVPSVIFGPGFIEQAHTADEWVAEDQIHKATEILYRFCVNEWSGLHDAP